MRIYNLTVLGKAYGEVKKASPLIDFYNQIKDSKNDISATKGQIQSAFSTRLGTSLNRRTLNEWVLVLCVNQVIKYKTNGRAMLNPFMFFDGTEEEYENTINIWNQFKTDIPMNKEEMTTLKICN